MKLLYTSQEAEQLIANLLECSGWKILARNYRWIGTEIDIIALKKKTIVFVEVKLRKEAPKSNYELSSLISPQKRRSLWQGAQLFIHKTEKNYKFDHARFDLALVTKPRHHQTGLRVNSYFVGI